MVWEALNKAVEKDNVILSTVTEIDPPSKAWCALVKMAAKPQDAASERVKEELKGLELGSTKNVGEYFDRVNVALSKITKI